MVPFREHFWVQFLNILDHFPGPSSGAVSVLGGALAEVALLCQDRRAGPGYPLQDDVTAAREGGPCLATIAVCRCDRVKPRRATPFHGTRCIVVRSVERHVWI